MRDHRTELFSVEIPVSEDTPQPVRRIERGSGREAYFGIALDFTDDIDAGRYRAALTRTEARELYTALGDALAKADPRSVDTERDGTHVKVDAARTPEDAEHRRMLGPAVKAMRELAGIKQSDLAVACDISPGFLSNIEAGRKQPSPVVARAVANRLGVPIDAITYVIPGCSCTNPAAAA